ncbi:hypothetical protein FLONG3_9890 [Fusarium longipes]|uniref:Uncharacterized protein n=1 Tax=Fusarium longipes TaxID=694270 RepID=A0A395RTG9_9HYPO|nr:hypothetical protein FLONG3_9890 [Fusarium longipes]
MAHRNPTHGQKVDLGQNAPVKEEGAGKVASESLAAESIQEGGVFASNEGIRGENQQPSGSEHTSSQRATHTSSAHSSHSKSGQSGSGKSSASHTTKTSSAPSSDSKSGQSGQSGSDKHSDGHSTKTSSGLGSSSDSKPKSGHSGSKKQPAGHLVTAEDLGPYSQSKAKSAHFDAPNGADAPSYVENQYIRNPGGPHGKDISEGFDDSKTEDGLKKALQSEPGSEDDPSRLAELRFEESQTAAGRDAGPRQTGLSSETPFDALDNESSS